MITGQRLLDYRLPGPVTVESDIDVGDVRRLAGAAARAQGFDPTQAGRVAIVATELATNLAKYAEKGRVLVRLVERAAQTGVEIVALDCGPGMRDAEDRRADGYSTGGTSGGGFGAVGRLSDFFDLHSVPGRGTVAVARLWGTPVTLLQDDHFLVGAVAEAAPEELVSGDAWAVEQCGDRIAALMVDGLGHGPGAAEASTCAVEAFRHVHRGAVETIVDEIQAALRSTRGAAVAVATIDAARGMLRFSGVGNISARLVGVSRSVHLLSRYGIAGLQSRPAQAVVAAWGAGDLLVMHTDGLSSKWDLDEYPGVAHHHPALAAATIARDATRQRDDASVLTVRAANRGSD